MSWDELNNIGREPTAEEQAAFEKVHHDRISDFVSVFTSPAGRRVLKYLRDNTIERPTFVQPGAGSDGRSMQKLQDMREGENNLVRRIETMIKQGGVEL